MTADEIEIFARGLYWLADRDGIHEQEITLIREFLKEAGSDLTIDDVKGGFSPLEAAQVLEATYLRRIFLRAAVALIRADGVYSDQERHALGELADVFGISNAEFGDLEQEASRAELV